MSESTNMKEDLKTKSYYFTAIISLLFAVIGFSYNAWRMEISEDNNNIRTAAFEVLIELAELERIVFAAHYDKDPVVGNPRKGWVSVGLISDLSVLINSDVEKKSAALKQQWSNNWQSIADNRKVADAMVGAIDEVRAEIKQVLMDLK